MNGEQRETFWMLDPEVTFLNHGSFGSCPEPVLAHQQEWRNRMERQPVQFFVRELEGHWDQARGALAGFLGAETEDLVFVPSATAGVNTVLRSLTWERGDEVLVTQHEYNACRNALEYAAAQSGAKVVVAKIPFPLESADQVLDSVLSAVSSRTRLALLDHVTSQTGIILPLEQLVERLAERGIDTLVDGAHAPGMIPLHLGELGAAYYTGNCHKWLCAPKGSGFLHVRRDKQPLIRPLAISHGANSPRKDRSRFLIEFGWTGTWDPSAYLSVPKALEVMGGMLPGGWEELMRRNHQLALAGRKPLADALGCPLPCPDELVGALASLPLPEGTSAPPKSPLYADPLQEQLWNEYQIEVPVIPWPAPPQRLLRISAQLYNSADQYEYLAKVLPDLLEGSR